MIPTIAFHGELDTLVPIDSDNSFANYTLDGSRALHNLLIANNTCSELTVDTLGEHGIFRNTNSVFRAQRASCFFKSVFCANCSNLYTTDSIPSNCSTSSSVDENNFSSVIKVYPNPFENSISIEGMEGTSDITLFNRFGQVVYMGEKNKGTIQIDLKPGIYFLNINQIESNLSFTTKLIKN
jgi:hypothetical protein